MLFCKASNYDLGNSLVVQWLGLRACTAVGQVWSLVWELRSHKPCDTAKKKIDGFTTGKPCSRQGRKYWTKSLFINMRRLIILSKVWDNFFKSVCTAIESPVGSLEVLHVHQGPRLTTIKSGQLWDPRNRQDPLCIGIMTDRPNRSSPLVINTSLFSTPGDVLLISSITTVRSPSWW